MATCEVVFNLLTFALVSGLALTATGQQSALPIGHLTAADKEHIKHVLTDSLVDVKSAHFAALGYQSLGEKFDAVAKVCPLFQASAKSEDIEVLYHAVSGASLLGANVCKVQVSNFGQFMKKQLASPLTSDQLLQLVSTARILNETVDSSVVYTLVQQLRKKDSSALNLANLLQIVSSLKLEKSKFETVLPDVKALLDQADEADGIYLYYDKGVYTTALAIDSIFKVAAAVGKAPVISEQQVIKFANFLYSKRRTQQPRAAAFLLVAMRTLSSNAFMVPIVVTGASAHERAAVSGLTISSKRQVSLRLANLLGETQLTDAKKIDLTAAGLHRLPSSASTDSTLLGPASRGAFKASTECRIIPSRASAALSLQKIKCRWFLCPANAEDEAPRQSLVNRVHRVLVWNFFLLIPVRVLYKVRVTSPQLSLATGDSSRAKVDIPVTVDKKLTAPAEVAGPAGSVRVQRNDQLHLTFSLSDSVSGSPVNPHQVFIQLMHEKTRQSITYICEKTSSVGAYSFKLIPDNLASDFDHLYGVYSMDLLIGDALLTNSLTWRIADLDIHLPIDDSSLRGLGEPDIAQQSVASVASRKRSELNPLIGRGPSKAKPELEHTFRIFALYLWYWVELNMFTTLRYLFLIGTVTFFAGNRLLRHLSSVRKGDAASGSKSGN
ncbi:unnamed protein product [Dibothriocephalus latus]|uniref:Dolichyl-diphosphooligosaccharide--protein glycosyltransferase subunit 2 n=1 Tax=Dibothriocephalus latus TaxID=60516 RepID=A0A3P6VDF8_DIBLA|nr:unnamed protein product [Dibothriocephalus latus]